MHSANNKSQLRSTSVFTSSNNLSRDDFLIFELVCHAKANCNNNENPKDQSTAPPIHNDDSEYSILYHNWTLRQLYRHVVSSIKEKTHVHPPPVVPSPKGISRPGNNKTVDESVIREHRNEKEYGESSRPRSVSLSSSTQLHSKTISDPAATGEASRPSHHHRRQSSGIRHHHRQTSSSGTDFLLANSMYSHNNTIPKLLGSNLHPRDMRRLVTPFSASNEPELIVRRHVMVFNFDPLRAIITRDRLLVLVPTGADSILKQLEERIVGSGIEYQDYDDYDAIKENENYQDKDASDQNAETTDETTTIDDPSDDDDDWSQMMLMEMDQRKDLTFELLCVNACLSLVFQMLADDTEELQEKGLKYVQTHIIGDNKQKQTQLRPEDALAVIRNLKNAVKVMQARVKGLVHSINRILNEDEDMALMNVSRLISHPENFVQPVSLEMLEIESDEPELVLESNLHNALTLSNALDLIEGQVDTASDLIDARMDAARNKFLLASLCLSIASLSLTALTCVGGIFGMNLKSGIEEESGKFILITYGSIAGSVFLGIAIFVGMIQTGVITGIGPVDKEGIDSLF